MGCVLASSIILDDKMQVTSVQSSQEISWLVRWASLHTVQSWGSPSNDCKNSQKLTEEHHMSVVGSRKAKWRRNVVNFKKTGMIAKLDISIAAGETDLESKFGLEMLCIPVVSKISSELCRIPRGCNVLWNLSFPRRKKKYTLKTFELAILTLFH